MSKTLIVLMVGMLAVGCGKQEQAKQEQADTNESTPTTNTNKVNGTTAKPVKELTLREKVVGTYEKKFDEGTIELVFLGNGIREYYLNGNKTWENKWSIVDGEIHIKYDSGSIDVFRINKDKSITEIAQISKDEKREEVPKEDQVTWKKIK